MHTQVHQLQLEEELEAPTDCATIKTNKAVIRLEVTISTQRIQVWKEDKGFKSGRRSLFHYKQLDQVIGLEDCTELEDIELMHNTLTLPKKNPSPSSRSSEWESAIEQEVSKLIQLEVIQVIKSTTTDPIKKH